MIFTTTRELFLDYASIPLLLCNKWPPSYAVDLVDVSIPRTPVIKAQGRRETWGTYNESMVNSSSHSEGSGLDEE